MSSYLISHFKGLIKPSKFLLSYNKGATVFLKDFLYLFLERGKGREKERERNISWLPLICPQLGTWRTTQAHALTGN